MTASSPADSRSGALTQRAAAFPGLQVQQAHIPFGSQAVPCYYGSPGYAASLKQIFQARITTPNPSSPGPNFPWLVDAMMRCAEPLGGAVFGVEGQRKQSLTAAVAAPLSRWFVFDSQPPSGIFVVPRSDQCYPEYLITFQ